MITVIAEIEMKKRISDSLFLLSVKLEKYKEWIPGMFMQISLDIKKGSDYWLDSRAFSFANWGSSEGLILVRKEGPFTTELISRSENGFLTSVRYPFGDFLLNSNADKVFLAGGAGISVFLSYLDFISERHNFYRETLIFYSVREADEDIFNIYERSLPDGVSIAQFVTDPNSHKYTGRMNIEIVRKFISQFKSKEFYVCGPPQFNKYWQEKLGELGSKVKIEQWINISGGMLQ